MPNQVKYKTPYVTPYSEMAIITNIPPSQISDSNPIILCPTNSTKLPIKVIKGAP
jgi:hypothetical protein